MFTEESFSVFQVPGLESRMNAIRSEIQPVFQTIGNELLPLFNQKLNASFYLHIAQHRRRSVHPPENTWAAFSEGKRGYKMAHHFQIGIWPDHVFLWLSMIDQPKQQVQYAQTLLNQLELFDSLPEDTMLNTDHTKNTILPATDENLATSLERFAKIKKAEFQIGRTLPAADNVWQNPDKALDYMKETYLSLLPLYQTLKENNA